VNLVEINAQIPCDEGQAKALVGHFDHVEFHGESGVARLRLSASAEGDPLTGARRALDRIEEVCGEVGIDLTPALEFTVSSEALISVDGSWRRRGEVVPSSLGAI
jgi:hypothetical protein